jgi:hypothetical protein
MVPHSDPESAFQGEPEQGDQQEPVAAERDQRRQIELAEIGVSPEQRERGPDAPQLLDRLARHHGDLPDYRERGDRPGEAERSLPCLRA